VFDWIWRHLPGSTPVKWLLVAVIVLVTVTFLFLVVFPWITPRLPFTDVTIGAYGGGADNQQGVLT
jgi:hypothetical protein